jgi:hypothetical protein
MGQKAKLLGEGEYRKATVLGTYMHYVYVLICWSCGCIGNCADCVIGQHTEKAFGWLIVKLAVKCCLQRTSMLDHRCVVICTNLFHL